MSTILEIPLVLSTNQSMSIALNGTTYVLIFKWNTVSLCWVLDVYQDDGATPIVRGIPIVTGADLLAQLGYLGFGGALFNQNTDSEMEVAEFNDVGPTGRDHLYFATP